MLVDFHSDDETENDENDAVEAEYDGEGNQLDEDDDNDAYDDSGEDNDINYEN
jgi:hypothetical protein